MNKDKIADGIEKFLLAAVQVEEAPLPTKKSVLTTEERKEAILNDEAKNFKIISNNEANSEAPWHRKVLKNQVKMHEKIINKEAKKSKIDPDLVKAIVYLETSQGYYDEWFPDNRIKTIRPMNVYASYWEGLGYSRKDLEDPEKNIQAGIKLLKRIKKNTPHADVAKIATLYNSLGARTVDNYGAQVEKIYNEKPWKDKK